MPVEVIENTPTGLLISSMSAKLLVKTQVEAFLSSFKSPCIKLLKELPRRANSIVKISRHKRMGVKIAKTKVTDFILCVRTSSKAIQERLSSNSFFRYSNLRCETLMFLCLSISTLPKGLISWIQGYQDTRGRYPSRSGGENHQFKPNIPCSVSSQSGFSRGVSSRDSGTTTRSGYYKGSKIDSWWLPTISFLYLLFGAQGARRVPARLEFLRCYSGNVNDTHTKIIGRKDSPRYLFTEVTHSGVPVTKKLADDGPFGKGRNSRTRIKETRFRSWNASRSYREHPYWTANLKYVC